ncbi:hypothetical protein BU16DRAFT_602275 [Lophium mytilinum]|uniref:Uncharacterized protein n=1 Tax=Lophium mytilinum TaxID=390894 RepID=A0A6A6R7B8_9PEZI|nr:hypothetical protein BU16DRAFT_602275 [Lophium mytilinum]
MAHQPQTPSSAEASRTASESPVTMDQSSTEVSHDDASTAATSPWTSSITTPLIPLTPQAHLEQDLQILGRWMEDVVKDSHGSEDEEIADDVERRNGRGTSPTAYKEDTDSFQIITSGLDVGGIEAQTDGYDYYGICDVVDTYADAGKPGVARGKEGMKVIDDAKRKYTGERSGACELAVSIRGGGHLPADIPSYGVNAGSEGRQNEEGESEFYLHDRLEGVHELLEHAANENGPQADRARRQSDDKVAPTNLAQEQAFRHWVESQFLEVYVVFREHDERIKEQDKQVKEHDKRIRALEYHSLVNTNRSNHSSWFGISVVMLMVGLLVEALGRLRQSGAMD